MRFSVYISLYLSFLIQWINAQTDVWHEAMNIDPTTSSWTLSTQTNTLLTDTVCPSTDDYCWSLEPSLVYYREADTTAFVSVQLTYSMDTATINGQDYCLIEYSLDGTNFVDIERIDAGSVSTSAIAATYSAWNASGINSALRIQISASGSGNKCYFNEFRLWGTPITPQPTSTTAVPSKSPTNAPSSPPSAAPSTSPSGTPTAAPSGTPIAPPTNAPSLAPTNVPSGSPSAPPTAVPSRAPTNAPSGSPSSPPTNAPSLAPTNAPSGSPSSPPSRSPSRSPIPAPTISPTDITTDPSHVPSSSPSETPTSSTIAPSSSPTLAPSHAPSGITMLPTAAPSTSPTNAPSGSPSQPPTNAPSGSPSAPPTDAPSQPPTNSPSAAPTATTAEPSTSPTTEPTVITSNPTPNPTLKTLNCATYTTCYTVDVVPLRTELISTPIVIQATGSSTAYYDVTFNIWGSVSCNDPWLEFIFEAIDNDSSYEYLLVTDVSTGTQIGYCGRSSNYCNAFTDCAISTINNGLDIATNTSVTYRVTRDSSVGALCSTSHSMTINAVLTLYCDDRTISPTVDPTTSPTAAPSDSTFDPTIAPSSAPSTPPSAAPSKATLLPTSAPTNAPTSVPSGSPTAPPSVTPSNPPTAAPSTAPTQNTSAPTLFPSLTPTIATSQPTNTPTYRYYCADRYCYDRSITPVAGESVSQSVNMVDSNPGYETYFDLNLYIAGAVDCNRPSVDFSFERIDNDNSLEFLYLAYESSTIASCGYVSNSCGSFYACATDLSLGPSTISAGTTITITVTKEYAVGAFCTHLHSYAMNAVLNVTCNDKPTTASPTDDPTQATLDPTPSPTDPPTMQKCSRTDPTATVCYQQYVSSYYTYATNTFSTSIYRYDGDNPDIYDIYYTASSPCYNPSISVMYQYVDSYNGITVLDANGNQLGSCSGATACGTRSYCMQDYNLGLDVLETSKSYVVTLFGRYLTNGCSSSVTTDAIVYFICDMIPTTTLSPTGAPTQPTSDPTTGAPTQPTANPTPDPTLADLNDGGGEFSVYILANLRNSAASYSLILMTQSVESVDLELDTFLDWSLKRGDIESISEMTAYSFCSDAGDECRKFWNVEYAAICPLDLEDSAWKMQLTTSCLSHDYGVKKQCVDYLKDNQVNNNKIALFSANSFGFVDNLCAKSLYEMEATLSNIIFYKNNKANSVIRNEGNLKYKEGDKVTIELEIELASSAYVVDSILFENIIGCHLNETSPVLSEDEAQTGIASCLLQDIMYVLESETDSETSRLSFIIPSGVKKVSQLFTIQMQAMLSIKESRRRLQDDDESDTEAAHQVRYFVMNVLLNGKASEMTSGSMSGGQIAAIIISVVAVCVIIVLVYFCRKGDPERKKKKETQKGTEMQIAQLEAVKSVDSMMASPSMDEEGDNNDNKATGYSFKKQKKEKEKEKEENEKQKKEKEEKEDIIVVETRAMKPSELAAREKKKKQAKRAGAAAKKTGGAKKAAGKKAGAKKAGGVKKGGAKKAKSPKTKAGGKKKALPADPKGAKKKKGKKKKGSGFYD